MLTTFDPLRTDYTEAGEYVRPAYEGLSIANVLPTVLSHFGVQSEVAPLDSRALRLDMLRGADCIVTLVLDAFGYLQMADAAARGSMPYLSSLIESGHAHLGRLTSTFPSTTVTALTTLGSGLTPARHKVISQVFFDSALGTTVDVLRFQPAFAGRPLASAGVDPGKWAGFSTVYQQLDKVGVRSAVVNHAEFEQTSLSLVNHRGASYVGFDSLSDLAVNLRHTISSIQRPAYIHAYWAHLDTISHLYGVTTEQQYAEIRILDHAISTFIIEQLDTPNTLLLIFSDHGHIDTDAEHTVWLDDHPQLLDMLMVPPAGIPRARLLHAKPGKVQRVMEYLRATFGEVAWIFTTGEAIEMNLYDMVAPGPKATERLGDVLIVPKDNWLVQYRGPEPRPYKRIIGRHGGLSPEEMVVPFIAIRNR